MPEKAEIRQETTLRDFLNVIFRRKWIIVSVVALATVTVFFLNARKPAFWESTSRLLVQRGERNDVFSGQVRYLSWQEEVSSQIEVILSESVFNGAREVFTDSVVANGLPEVWKFQPGRVRANVVGESNVFTISYVDLNPQVARFGCQAMTLSFQDFYLKRKAPPALEDFFASQIKDVQVELEFWQVKRNDFLNKEKFYGMAEENYHLLQQVSSMERELVTVESSISIQIGRVDNLAALKEKTGEELEQALAMRLSQQFMQREIIQRIKLNLQALNMEHEQLLQKYTEKHPEVMSVQSQIVESRKDLEVEIENAYQIESQELEALYSKKASLTREISKSRARLDELPDIDRELNKYDITINNLKSKYELLLKRQSETDIALAGQSTWEVTILSNASPPYSKKTSDYVRLALGPLLSIVVAFGLAFFLESLDHSVKNMSEAEEHLDLPVLATISEMRDRP